MKPPQVICESLSAARGLPRVVRWHVVSFSSFGIFRYMWPCSSFSRHILFKRKILWDLKFMIIYTMALSNWHRDSLIETTTEMAFSSIINKIIYSACKWESCLYSQEPFYVSVVDPCRVPEHCIPILDLVTPEPLEDRARSGQDSRAVTGDVWREQGQVQLSREI